MKRSIVFILVLLFSACLCFGFNSSDKDYKVIKNAVKKRSVKKDTASIRIVVESKKDKTECVKLNFPLSIIELIAENCKESYDVNGCKINMKKILKDLKSHGPKTLVEVFDDDAIIKIWIE